MKRIIALALLLVMLLTMVSCGSAAIEQTATLPAETKTEVKKTEEKDPYEGLKHLVAEPLTWEKINELPIANSSMSTDELRQLCIDFMHLQLTFPWQATKRLTYSWGGNQYSIDTTTVYGGHPYVSSTSSNLYKAMFYYDEKTGFLDTSKMGANFGNVMGNQCSSNSYWGWARVCNSIEWAGTSEMTRAHGAIPLGNYYYDANLTDFHATGTHTGDICRQNGEQVMYQAYAQMKKADGIVYYYRTAGHVQMATQNAVVVYNNGAIDPEQSYVMFQDQQTQRKMESQSNGTPIYIMAGVEHKITFKKLYEGGYLPFTIAELIGTNPIETATADFSHKDTKMSFDQFSEATLTSNYGMSDLIITVKDSEGNEKLRKLCTFTNAGTLNVRNFTCSDFDLFKSSFNNVAGKGYTITLDLRLGNGQSFHVYEGEFVK